MTTNAWDARSLVAFEEELAELFNSGAIRAPVHLSNGSEESLIRIFSGIDTKQDWIFCSWRSHYQALLHGIPADSVKSAVREGRSIAMCFPEYRFYASAIVGGQVPLAVGAAAAMKIRGESGHVWCFVGDMTSEIGIFQTALKYSRGHSLPITFVVEDNQVSVCTNTKQVWGLNKLTHDTNDPHIEYFSYTSKYPHAGAGKRVEF